MAEEPSACGSGICSRAMARIRNQNRVPAAAITTTERTTASTFPATSSARLAVMTERPSSAWKPSTAQYFPRHMNTAATSMITPKMSPPAILWLSTTSASTATRTMLPRPISAATTAATLTAVGSSPGASGSSEARTASARSRERA